ncbi:flagellar basal body-associated FliL family protein [Pseudoxanthomonas daejeonensis]|uniref:Flagellar protein FliL n=1 Tax=Pseudoxanthomonas daejeonensis TaxID=266062 RepID=A0ABQ6Z6A7_9GAMM|nr:flagellar basal body-associated FliL family protein [Pseudoxanthomonas daejeonensis]KAF1694069.1 flagellar basal body protein FliL [Pseudoxanthomonas daejeonensis]UNK57269.1 flagellar basal body-associated FliL family protein [Pseudoxanthomonas daejeonensis]
MATAADKNSRATAQKGAAHATKAGSKLPLIISAVAVLAAAGAGGGWYWSSRQASAAEQAAAEARKPKLPAPAQYLALEPPFVVNLTGANAGPQYLQVEIQLMTRDPAALAQLERHAPAIRARLLMLLAQQDAQGIADRTGKEKLQALALAEVRKLMRAETGSPSVEELLFTSFVTQ